MTATSAIAVTLALWIASGLGASYVMARRGHDPFTWWWMGALLGPLVIVTAIARIRREASTTPARIVTGEKGQGTVDVLVGIDGSPQASAALDAVVRLLGERIGRMTLALVEYIDDATPDQDSLVALRREAARLGSLKPELLVLQGAPARMLAEHGRIGDFDLIVVGSRGSGLSELLLGSVAETLAKSSPVPVLIVRP